tara:strand:- start:44 stop:787 length:744 start_codon:yes stop_codon:yes gene_type:complete
MNPNPLQLLTKNWYFNSGIKAFMRFVGVLVLVFTLTLLLFKGLDVFSVEDIKQWLQEAQKWSSIWVGSLIIALLIVDLFIAIPTLSLTILSGFFLGLKMGILFSYLGLMLSGSLGYLISRYHGLKLLNRVCKNESEKIGMIHLYQTLGPLTLLLCRAAPMLPEITSCLAGTTRMPYWKYVFFYTLGSLPYAAIAVYSGSISTVDNPSPAIYTYVGMFAVLGLIGLIVMYFKRHELVSIGDHEIINNK